MSDELFKDRDWLYEQYVVKNQSLSDIGRIAGCSPKTIGNWLAKHGILARPASYDNKWENAEYREQRINKQSLMMKDLWTDERKKQHSETIKENWTNPEYRELQTEYIRQRWQDPEYREQMSEMSKAQWTEEKRLQQSEVWKELWQDPEYRERMSAISKEIWNDPKRDEIQKETIKKILKNKRDGGHRTDIETITEQELIRREVLYVFEYQIGRWSIDFFLPDYSVALECDGDYWHDKRADSDEIRDERLFQLYGIRTIRLKGSDIKNNVALLIESALASCLD